MKTNYLFPHRFKKASGIIFLITFLLLTILLFFDMANFEFRSKVFAIIGQKELGKNIFFSVIDESVTDEILIMFIIPFGIIYAFSKEKNEDEMVSSIRLHSLAWATILNYAIIFFSYIFIYGLPFLYVLMGAMFSQLLIFIILFRYNIYKLNKAGADEE